MSDEIDKKRTFENFDSLHVSIESKRKKDAVEIYICTETFLFLLNSIWKILQFLNFVY